MYRRNTFSKTCNCEFNNCCPTINPLDVPNTFPAGQGCAPGYCDEQSSSAYGCPLATALFVSQEYLAGFCPDQALQCGTMFPELVRPW